jgi:hypothetical protein
MKDVEQLLKSDEEVVL